MDKRVTSFIYYFLLVLGLSFASFFFASFSSIEIFAIFVIFILNRYSNSSFLFITLLLSIILDVGIHLYLGSYIFSAAIAVGVYMSFKFFIPDKEIFGRIILAFFSLMAFHLAIGVLSSLGQGFSFNPITWKMFFSIIQVSIFEVVLFGILEFFLGNIYGNVLWGSSSQIK